MGGRPDLQRLVEEPGEDEPEQRCDRQLEPAHPVSLDLENRECDHTGDQARGEKRNSEQQVQAERCAQELGDVGRHRHHLGLDPEADAHPPREALAAQLGQVPIGHDPELGRQILDQHRHQVGQHHDPQQRVAEFGAALDVRREVARIDVRDRGHERRTEHRERGAEPSSLEQ